MLDHTTPATLILADGTEYHGYSFGAQGTTIGQVVFHTGMTGYQEILTDPNYYGQIVVQTFPLIGNYGTNSQDNQADQTQIKGYIVRQWCETPSNFRCEASIDSFLKTNNIIAIYGIDTRSLTRLLREQGVMNGMITTEAYDKQEALEQIAAFEIKDAVKAVVSTKQAVRLTSPGAQYEIAMLDFGAVRDSAQLLQKRGCNVTILPPDATAQQILALSPDGVVLSDGPGDPRQNTAAIETVRALLQADMPMLGISLGHQILALANGLGVEPLKYGHRGANQPVLDVEKQRTYVTAQNHGYVVVCDALNDKLGFISHYNANDKTCEGIRYQKALGIQFQPHACGSPTDTDDLYDVFLGLLGR